MTPVESYSWRIIQHPFGEIVERTWGDAHPPLSYLVQKAWTFVTGDSLCALRGLSVLFGLSAILVAVATLRWVRKRENEAVRFDGSGMILVILLAVHPLLISQFFTARMYPLGVFLTALTSFFLLHSLTFPNRPTYWLIAYGISSAAFALTHYFAFFTLAGQLSFAAAFLVHAMRKGDRAKVVAWLSAACWGAGIAIVLYASWWPAFLSQRREVQAVFWLEAISWDSLTRVFIPWATGISADYGSLWILGLWLICFAVLVRHADWAAWLFLAQAVAPWALALGYSLATGRPIVHERYFSFAAFAWLCFIGFSWSRIRSPSLKWAVGGIIGWLLASGFIDEVRRWPEDNPVQSAARHLAANYRDGDVCWADSPIDVNILRYYLAMEGLRAVNVRLNMTSILSSDHQGHFSSLTVNDVFWGRYPTGKRIWRCTPQSEILLRPPPGMMETWRQTFHAKNSWVYTIVLIEPEGKKGEKRLP